MAAPNIDAAQALTLAQQEMEYRVALFNKMTSSCFDKCADKKYKSEDLTLGETTCLDRCSRKYWQVTGIVGQMLSAQGSLQ